MGFKSILMAIEFCNFPPEVIEAHDCTKKKRFSYLIDSLCDNFDSEQGSVTMVTGPMMSGKSSFMFEFREAMSDKSFYYFQPTVNTREDNIDSREFEETIMATKTNSARDVLLTLCNRNIDLRNCVICIDEVQFYDEEIIIVAETLRLEGAHVVCCGLDMDYRGESFAFAKIENARYLKALELLKAAGLADMIKSPMSIGHLMAISNHVVKLSARTFEGDEATHTMKTSIASEAIVEIGDNDIYKPVPASCNPQVMERVQKFKLLLDL